jgi:hypothetical protein
MPVETSETPGQDNPLDLFQGNAEERMRAEMQKALADDPEIQAVIQALARKKKT